ncbi:MAG: metallophosphatase family protein, partial [Armatimonadota bacterium]|nr:metallophosphatase family protein [Armatimonadota bacterium]
RATRRAAISMTTIGLISDTHIIRGGRRQLPPRVFEVFDGVDFILHAGDLNILQVVTDLEAIAPTFAVYGNNDDWEALHTLPATRRMEVEQCVVGLVHGDQGRDSPKPLDFSGNRQTAANALSRFVFEDDVNCVVFGHSHRSLVAWHELCDRKVLLFNPGSPTDRRYGPHHSVGLLRVDGKRLEPELITW